VSGADEAGLRAAVFADPDADAPRAVYADWLMERGRAYGRFIDAQLRGDEATARKHLPAAEDATRIPIDRFTRLEQSHAAGWELACFDRGFVSRVTIETQAMSYLSRDVWPVIQRMSLLADDAGPLMNDIATRLGRLSELITNSVDVVELLTVRAPRVMKWLRVDSGTRWFDWSPLVGEQTRVQAHVGPLWLERTGRSVRLSASRRRFSHQFPTERALRALIPADANVVSETAWGVAALSEEVRALMQRVPHATFEEQAMMVVG